MSYTNRGSTLRMRQALHAQGTAGMLSGQIMATLGGACPHLHNLLSQAVRKGTIWRVRTPLGWRYFAAQAHAVAYAKLHQLEVPRPPAPLPGASASPAAGTPPHINTTGPAAMPGEPIITPRTRIVRIAMPQDPRFTPERRVRVVDPNECRPWAREVIR